MNTTRTLAAAAALSLLAACAVEVPTYSPEKDLAHLWVKNSADYEALTRQVYGVATRDLERFVADTSWSAMPEQTDAEDLPPAIILDVDETVINNVDFQVVFERPFTDRQLEMWDRAHEAKPVPGVVEFVTAAHEAGIATFFLTNRPCEASAGEHCPQKAAVIGDLVEAGFPADEANVSLSYEQPGWTKEKSIRRSHIAKDHRVIMLFGDDLGDFIACTRKRPIDPCAAGATRASRRAQVGEFSAFWGNGWYVLPNPMHGSWTSMEE